jgi:hypothetical protein
MPCPFSALNTKIGLFIFSGVSDKLIILDYPINLGDLLATILVKNLPEDLLKELKKLKIELGCRTWAELLAKLVESERVIALSEEKLKEMRAGVQGFLKLGSVVSSRWTGHPTVLDEVRRSRNHETG